MSNILIVCFAQSLADFHHPLHVTDLSHVMKPELAPSAKDEYQKWWKVQVGKACEVDLWVEIFLFFSHTTGQE